MSTSYGCEDRLRTLANELHDKAYELEKAADVLKVLRESESMKDEIKLAQQWAKDWLRP